MSVRTCPVPHRRLSMSVALGNQRSFCFLPSVHPGLRPLASREAAICHARPPRGRRVGETQGRAGTLTVLGTHVWVSGPGEQSRRGGFWLSDPRFRLSCQRVPLRSEMRPRGQPVGRVPGTIQRALCWRWQGSAAVWARGGARVTHNDAHPLAGFAFAVLGVPSGHGLRHLGPSARLDARPQRRRLRTGWGSQTMENHGGSPRTGHQLRHRPSPSGCAFRPP